MYPRLIAKFWAIMLTLCMSTTEFTVQKSCTRNAIYIEIEQSELFTNPSEHTLQTIAKKQILISSYYSYKY